MPPAMVVAGLVLAVGLGACGDDGPTALELGGEPGRVNARRLNRAEYDNTVADLLGSRLAPARDFPADDRAFGFDNVADALHLSTAHVELLEQATWALVDEAFAARDAGDAAVRERVFVCDPAPDDPLPCVREIVAHLVPRAWRRPIDDATEDRFVALFERAQATGASDDDALRTVLATVLLSPQFLFRIERDAEEPGAQPLDDWALASRLSYFLWSSMPDHALFAAAKDGRLRDADGLADEARRMLADPRARALVDDFAGQWLSIRGIDDLLKDAHRFPDYDDALATSMRGEMTALFEHLIEAHRPIQELVSARYGFVDARLAEHYGLDALPGDGFTKVSWGSFPRGGMLLTAGLLSVQAYPFTTSPVRRGRFVLEQLLCQPMGSPPDGIEMSAPSTQTGKLDASALRLADPACAGCHLRMDPIGFAFEAYDAVGHHRTTEDGEAIDTAGTLPDGRTFADAVALSQMVADDPAFVRCAVTKTLAYALGRGLGGADAIWIDEIATAFADADHDTAELFVLVASSPPFRYRGEAE